MPWTVTTTITVPDEDDMTEQVAAATADDRTTQITVRRISDSEA